MQAYKRTTSRKIPFTKCSTQAGFVYRRLTGRIRCTKTKACKVSALHISTNTPNFARGYVYSVARQRTARLAIWTNTLNTLVQINMFVDARNQIGIRHYTDDVTVRLASCVAKLAATEVVANTRDHHGGDATARTSDLSKPTSQ